MKISARNLLKGKVKKIVRGAVNSEVLIQLDSGAEIVSIITNSSVDSLQLQEGKTAYAVIKASNVMIAVDSLCPGFGRAALRCAGCGRSG